MVYCPFVELTDKPVGHWFSAEMLVAYQFTLEDYKVSVPLSPCEYDLVIDTGQRLIKIQVKKAAFRKQRTRPQGLGDRDHWSVDLTKRKGRGNAKYHKRINTDEFDYLAAVCNGSSVYIIPKEKLVSEQPGLMLKLIHIKEPLASGRADSIKAGERWQEYRNNFKVD
jgi:hypothetical protein